MLRLALGTTLSFIVAEMLDWELSFLITVFLVQLLTSPGGAPGLRQGIAIVAALGLATAAAATLSALLVGMPALFAIVLGLVLFLAFVLQRSGRSPALGTLILVAFGFLPVVAVQAPELVPAVAFYLVRSSAIAVLWAWLLQALLPDPETAASRVPTSERAAAPPDGIVRTALTDTAVLLPVLLLAMTLEVPAALVIVLTVTAVLTQHNIAGGRRVALGLLLGNLVGGVTAVVAYQLLSAVPTLGFLTALLLLVSLVYARLITGADGARPALRHGAHHLRHRLRHGRGPLPRRAGSDAGDPPAEPRDRLRLRVRCAEPDRTGGPAKGHGRGRRRPTGLRSKGSHETGRRTSSVVFSVFDKPEIQPPHGPWPRGFPSLRASCDEVQPSIIGVDTSMLDA